MNKVSESVSKIAKILIVAFIILLLIVFLYPQKSNQIQSSIITLPMSEGNFKRAEGERQFQFPEDHGAHPQYQTEWWYYTGNLTSAEGRHFGYQLTFFRRALQPLDAVVERDSNWATNQIYLAHFTISDIDQSDFYFHERFERGAAGLAGAEVDPQFRVWLQNWSVTQQSDNSYLLEASVDDNLKLNLILEDLKGPILQGDRGYSQKGIDPGNASYYYSQTRLKSRGTMEIQGLYYELEGFSWMDHEFSTSALDETQIGWDWFSIQLDNESEMMVYTVRRADNSIDPLSSGTIIQADGRTIPLQSTDFDIEILDTWRSPDSKATYPSGWVIRVPAEEIELEITPLIKNQELRVSFIYWEGAVSITGTYQGKKVTGYGYVELTGYAASMQGTF